ncbi:MAG TPA: phosphoenolpyruvate--protein phosphotransferase, partial [Ktedonobacteraceae bacterium]|nr:phosphoenolpyruvate--protein phosphotransferase [Ktedonobacteraceae bacterium]
LSLRQGEIVTIRASGADAQAALDALSELVRANFYETAPEGAKPAPTSSGEAPPPAYLPRRAGEPWRGITTSAGVAVGPAFLYTSGAISLGAVERHPISTDQVGIEQQRLREALHSAAQELHSLAIKLQSSIGQANAAIFDAQALMLLDPALREDTLHVIEAEQIDAAGALAKTGEHFAVTLETLDDPLIAARAVDVRDAVSRAIGPLTTQVASRPALSDLSQPVILIAKDLTPSDTAQLRPEFVLGICTIQGGPTAHAAILARALGIAAMAGLDETILQIIHSGDEVGLDANNGLLYQRPAPEVRAELMKHVVERQQLACDLRRTREDAQWRNQAGSTADGIRVQIFANVGDQEGARAAAESGAEGIGLLRTEFLFGGRAVLPNEQEQFESYVKLFRAFGERARLGKTIIARTLDAGADKPFPALEPLIGSMQEANPALGLRGARIHLVHEELLRQQLHALLRAGAVSGAELAIMFPMIATVEEVHRLRAVYDSVYHELEQEGIAVSEQTQVGIMVETPAAALMADMLVRYVDFFSIGANDLFQYTMAADRTNSRVTSMFGTLEPAVWRSIDMIARAGAAHGKLVAVCGELAADTRIGPLLAGLGVRELSMSPPAMLKVKAALHAHTMNYWQHQAQELLKAETAADMQAVLQSIE